jgi:hypothetical protein
MGCRKPASAISAALANDDPNFTYHLKFTTNEILFCKEFLCFGLRQMGESGQAAIGRNAA